LCSTWENELTVPSWWFTLFWIIIVIHGYVSIMYSDLILLVMVLITWLVLGGSLDWSLYISQRPLCSPTQRWDFVPTSYIYIHGDVDTGSVDV
jgi:hypothetical protein